MKHRNNRRLISLVLAFVMVVGLLPVGFANAQEAAVTANDAYEAPESLAPRGTAFTIDTLLAWTPESDPDAAYSRASIPLAERRVGFQVNDLSNPEANLMLCAYNDNPLAQGSESMLSYAFNYWQYVDSYIYWGGNGEPFIQAPTGEVIDAAHTNGVPIVGVLGFPWGSGYGYVEQVSAFCQKAEDGSFPVADKLIELMDYYGFDGWFFNQESYGCSAEIASRLNEMMRYMHAKRPGIIISWYDSMVESGGVSYQDAVNDYNKFWMTADENGNWGVDEFFMNYNWTQSKVNTTISTMKSIGRSQYDAFAGFNVQSNVYGDQLRDHLLVDEDGIAKLSLALYYSNQTQTVAKDGVDFHKTEQAYYVNAKGDPRDTSVDVANSSVTTWAGMSRFFADKSPILSAPFVTDFNTGHGLYWFVNGEKLRDSEWSYQSNQDILPTFTWIIDSTGSKLEGGYDFEDAYNGGSSVRFSGKLDARNDILLYSTFVDVTGGLKLNLTAKGGLENASLVAYLGDSSTTSYDDCEKVAFELTTGEGWVETSADLSAYAGKTLYAIGLKVEGEADDYALNLGRISIIDKNRNGSNGPSDLRVEAIAYTDPYSAEARVRWSKVTGASSYEIYKVHADGTKTFIMETPNTAYYIPTLTRDEDETDVTIEVVPVNRNGVRGKASELVIDWAYGNDDGERLVKETAVNVNLNATVTGYSEQGDGAECSKALDGVSGNASKWWASGVGDWFTIDLGEPKTIKRIRMEHAEAGGEGKDLNTAAYTVYYKDDSGNWVQALKVTGNTAAVNDLLLDTPVTAQEWKLYINGIGPSPWSAVNIYEWQMFETGFPATEPVAMRYASAFNGEGAADTFSLKNIPAERTVKVYNADGEVLGEAVGSGTVELTGLDFGTDGAGRVYYTVTESGYGESVKFSAAFEAEAAGKSEPATDVEFAAYSQPGSVSSSNGDDIYTTLTVNGLSEGDVVYVLGAEPKASLPVVEGKTSVSIEGVRVVRAGGALSLQVKRVGSLISDVYSVETPAFADPTATVQVFAENAAGETLTGVRFDILDSNGDAVAQMSTTSDSGAKATVALGTYTIRNTESPEGYGLANDFSAILRIEGWQNVYTVTVPAGGEEPDPTDPTDPDPTDPPVVIDPADDSRDIPLSELIVSCGDYEADGGASEGPAELAVDNDTNTLWHTDWYGTSRENHWFQFELTGEYNVDGLRYLPRQTGNSNGTITEYEVQVSEDGETFYAVASGTWEADSQWKYASFPDSHVKYVRLVAVNAVTDNSYVFASAAEIRLTGEVYVDPMPPEMEADDDSWDIPVSELSATCGDYEPDGGANEGPAHLVLDNNTATMWHTDWEGTSRENHWIQLEVSGDYAVCGLRYLPRQTGNYNGTITRYDIQVSEDGETFRGVATGDWEADSSWKIAQFRAEKVRFVRLVSLDAVTDNQWVFASAAEIRLTYLPEQTGNADKTELDALIAQCEQIEQGNYTAKTWQKFQKALEKARTVSANPYASQAQVDEALAGLAQARDGLKEKTGDGPEKIFHLDSGRKYFSKDWTIALLNELSAAGYTHLQLAFGNNGMRFLLDDMTIEANGTTYDSDAIKEGIKIGNDNYGALTGYSTGDAHALTESEMDEIIAHGKSVGVEIIPHLNMPGHMSALLDAMDYIGIEDAHFTGRVESDSSVNLNNEEALNFMFALTDKYAAYFAERGCKYFHIGADEYANDAYNGSMGFPSMGATLYQKFADFVNENAAIVKSYGMTPRAWNDGLYYGSYTSEFDSDIEINYWSSGWWGYTLAKSSTLNDKGHGLINTNGDYYYILGKDDRFTSGTSTTHNPNLYTECAGYDLNYFMDGSTIEEPVGGMFCVWADYPGAETEQEVGAAIRLVLRAMALRMEGVELDGMNTDVVAGGFNEDGSINNSGEQPHEHSFGEWTVTTAPTCTEKGIETRTCECGETETREVAALGHTEEIVPAKEATCTEDGLTEGKKCAVCGETLVAQEVIPALGHSWKGVECERCDATRENPFVDVPNDSFCIDPVLWAVEEGITTGTSATTFDPNGKCARAIVVTFLWRAAGSPEPETANNPFTDVKESDFYYKAVLWAVEEGITTGTSATTFSPTELCNRATVVTFLYRAMGSPEVSTTENPFSDVKVDSWYGPAVLWAVENGITNGMGDGTFGVGSTCTRAQVVTFLYRTLVK